ncbi:YjfB family protein [Clostridium sp. BL-8]|uniref:YjfB family protein n=1 Tax=Clostridium sp. BL-8 TaxID=349938 RepID=UPI0009CEF0F2|nr:YjfB family protein [Clostridium sp. BL-8]OOM78112.1 hypothetical protein CLOBL_25360 [Clostridium sp. BL-8]
MDLVNMAVNMQQGLIQDQVSVSVLKLTMDGNKEVAKNTIDMMEKTAVDPKLGNNIDALV